MLSPIIIIIIIKFDLTVKFVSHLLFCLELWFNERNKTHNFILISRVRLVFVRSAATVFYFLPVALSYNNINCL